MFKVFCVGDSVHLGVKILYGKGYISLAVPYDIPGNACSAYAPHQIISINTHNQMICRRRELFDGFANDDNTVL